jgi:hypothetical protein
MGVRPVLAVFFQCGVGSSGQLLEQGGVIGGSDLAWPTWRRLCAQMALLTVQTSIAANGCARDAEEVGYLAVGATLVEGTHDTFTQIK